MEREVELMSTPNYFNVHPPQGKRSAAQRTMENPLESFLPAPEWTAGINCPVCHAPNVRRFSACTRRGCVRY